VKLTTVPGGGAASLHLALQSATMGGVEYAAPGIQLTARAELAGVLVELGAEETLSAAAATLVARNVRLAAAETAVTIAEAQVEGLRVVVRGRSARVGADAIELRDVRVTSGETTVTLEKLSASTGLLWDDGRLDAGEITVSGLQVELALAAAEPAIPAQEAGPTAQPLPDLPALDHLDGHVAIDVTIRAAVPVIGSREVTHPLRVPIERGAISFEELEQGLSSVADSLLDFEVVNDELILELDVIPIVKFDNITLVAWSLAAPVDRDLAARKRVRLRRLLQFRLPSSTATKAADRHDSGSIRLLEVALDPIVADLSMRDPVDVAVGGGVVHLGGDAGAAAPSLTVRGALQWTLDGAPRAGHLDLTAAGVRAGLAGVTLGSIQVVAAELAVDVIEPARVELTGMSPRRITGTVHHGRLFGVRLAVRHA
jgi:hypothetical protein